MDPLNRALSGRRLNNGQGRGRPACAYRSSAESRAIKFTLASAAQQRSGRLIPLACGQIKTTVHPVVSLPSPGETGRTISPESPRRRGPQQSGRRITSCRSLAASMQTVFTCGALVRAFRKKSILIAKGIQFNAPQNAMNKRIICIQTKSVYRLPCSISAIALTQGLSRIKEWVK